MFDKFATTSGEPVKLVEEVMVDAFCSVPALLVEAWVTRITFTVTKVFVKVVDERVLAIPEMVVTGR